jgi:regulator of RNase E activity RraB
MENRTKRLPQEMIDLIKKIQAEALKQGFNISEAESMRIIARGYKSK